LLRNVCVAAVTSTIRDLPTEVLLGPSHGLTRECVANCDNLFTLPKSVLGRFRGSLGPEDSRQLNAALKIALDLD
jgi:mRNA interferase MazF